MKKILLFIVSLLPWFISSIFMGNNDFYESLNLPFFALPGFLYGIVWTILYILIAISIYMIYSEYKFKDIKSYNIALISNYIFNQLYTFIFFKLENTFLAFIDTVLIVITAINLYDETNKLNTKASKFLIPYIIFSIFACILSITIYFMNL
ncbi:MAG: tryptophan-rich sensory protein [Bacilli bacterium]|nr:tryptophan-rich sensory protein [Bacilli bacterium]